MKKYLQYIFPIIAFLLIAGYVFSAPIANVFRSIIPASDNLYYLGTTSPRTYWANIYTRELTISDGVSTTTVGFATTTLAGGIVIGGGGQWDDCLSGSIETNASGFWQCGSDSEGTGASYPFTPTSHFGNIISATTTSLFASGSAGLYASGTSIFSTTTIQGTLNASNIIATSTAASSSFAGLVARNSLEVTDNIVGSKLLNITGTSTIAGVSGAFGTFSENVVASKLLTITGTTTGAGVSLGYGTFSENLVGAKLLNITGLSNLGAITATGVIDFGGATSFEIPNAAGGTTVDATGEITLDTTSFTINAYDGANERVFGMATKTLSYIAPSATNTPFTAAWCRPYARTIKTVRGRILWANGTSSASEGFTFNFRHDVKVSASTTGTALFSASQNIKDTDFDLNPKTFTESFNDATLAANECLWLHGTGASSSAPTPVFDIEYFIDP